MAKKIEFSSILLTALQQVFQCGAFNDVSDYVVTTTAQTGKFCSPLETTTTTTTTTTPQSLPVMTTTRASPNEPEESSIHQDQIPALQPSHSSTSSIYVVPSREVLEDMVRNSRSTRRQGLFDMDRLFSCGSRESVAEDDYWDHHGDAAAAAAYPASTSSLFSTSVSKSSSGQESTVTAKSSRQGQEGQQQRQRQRPHEEMNAHDVEYRFKVQLSPPRTNGRHKMYTHCTSTTSTTFEQDPWNDYTLRKTMSDSLQQLPRAKSIDSGFTVHTSPQPQQQQ